MKTSEKKSKIMNKIAVKKEIPKGKAKLDKAAEKHFFKSNVSK